MQIIDLTTALKFLGRPTSSGINFMSVKESEKSNREAEIIVPDIIQSKAKEEISHLIEEGKIWYDRGGIIETSKNKMLKKGIEVYKEKEGGKTSVKQELPHTSKADKLNRLEYTKKLQELINIAFSESVYKAVKISEELKTPRLIDDFHDLLMKFHDELVKKGEL